MDRALVEQFSIDAIRLDEVLLEDADDLIDERGVDIGEAVHRRIGVRCAACGRLRCARRIVLEDDAPQVANGDQQHGDDGGQHSHERVARGVGVHAQMLLAEDPCITDGRGAWGRSQWSV